MKTIKLIEKTENLGFNSFSKRELGICIDDISCLDSEIVELEKKLKVLKERRGKIEREVLEMVEDQKIHLEVDEISKKYR